MILPSPRIFPSPRFSAIKEFMKEKIIISIFFNFNDPAVANGPDAATKPFGKVPGI